MNTNETVYYASVFQWLNASKQAFAERCTRHPTVAEALARIDQQTEPYAVATLFVGKGVDVYACDVEGRRIEGPRSRLRQFVRRGTNGMHPEHARFRAAWPSLVATIRAEQVRTRRGTVRIAERLTQDQWPAFTGWAPELGEMALQ
jgi:hypothetical protein